MLGFLAGSFQADNDCTVCTGAAPVLFSARGCGLDSSGMYVRLDTPPCTRSITDIKTTSANIRRVVFTCQHDCRLAASEKWVRPETPACTTTSAMPTS